MSYLRYVLFVFTSSCLQKGSCLSYVMFGSSLPPVVCRRAHVLFTLCIFVCLQWCPTHIVLCFCFVFLRLMYPVLPVSLDCPFLIATAIFSDVYVLYISTLSVSHIIQSPSQVNKRVYQYQFPVIQCGNIKYQYIKS